MRTLPHLIVAAAALLAAGAQAQTLPAPPAASAPVVDYEYDANGNPTKTIQAPATPGFGCTTSATYDTLDRRKDSTDARAGITRYGYNGREDLNSVTDPRNLVTQYPRNGLGDTTQLISPDTGTATHTYDAAGNLATRTDSRGVLATYSHDALNRLTGIVYSQSGQTSLNYTWTYDQVGAGYANGVGRLTSSASPVSSSQYTYDPQGRVLTDTQRIAAATGANTSQITRTVTYGYDTAGNVTSIVYPSGRKLAVTYAGGRPSAMTLAASTFSTPVNLITQIQWEPFGGVKSWHWQLASGTQLHERAYDAAGRIVRYRLGSTIRDLSRDAADRIGAYTHYDANTSAPTPVLDQGFGYDELGRLTSVSAGGSNWLIAYDANGNRSSVTLNGTARNYTTSATSNRLTSLSNPARSMAHDAMGNRSSDQALYASTYDLAGRLATLTAAGTTTTYAIDGFGRRVRKFNSSGAASTVIFVYGQDGQLLGEYSSTGAALREYVWLGATPIAVFLPNGSNPPLVYYIHADHLDAPRQVLDKSNKLRWRWMAEPFGTSAAETNPSGLGVFTFNLRFPGQYADSESGLSYNYFRDYDGSTARYTQSDPIGLAGGINTYAYVGGNPVSYIDPQGLSPAGVAIGIGVRVIGGRAAVGAIGAAARRYGPAGMVAACVLAGVCTFNEEAKPDREQKPDGCPTGTRPVDRDKRLDREKIHGIKGQINAGARDWVGISPDGRIWTNEGGVAVDNGPYTDYLP